MDGVYLQKKESIKRIIIMQLVTGLLQGFKCSGTNQGFKATRHLEVCSYGDLEQMEKSRVEDSISSLWDVTEGRKESDINVATR